MTEGEPIDARVLVVEDDRFNIRILTETCRSMGLTVRSVLDGLAALDAVVEEVPDLILLDVMLPGLDGYGVLERLRAQPKTRSVPVIMVTALTAADARTRALELGADDYVTKPFRLAELRTRIRSVLAMHAFRRGLKG